MTSKILPQESHFEDTADSVRVKTVVEKDSINPQMMVSHAHHFRLGAGTIIKVQVMSKDYDILFHATDFVIEQAVETSKRIIDERGERTANVTVYKIVQDTEWKSYSGAPEEIVESPARGPERYVPGDGRAVWNLGKQAYKITVLETNGEDRGVAWVFKLEGETKEEFKARAHAIAAGSEPLPEAA